MNNVRLILPFKILFLSLTTCLLCSCNNQVKQPELINIVTLFEQGVQEFSLRPQQPIEINQSASEGRWKATLGREDFKVATFTFFNNKVQKTLSFTKFGKYQITMTSQAFGDAPSSVRFSLIAKVE